jgi:hypothetical protein
MRQPRSCNEEHAIAQALIYFVFIGGAAVVATIAAH